MFRLLRLIPGGKSLLVIATLTCTCFVQGQSSSGFSGFAVASIKPTSDTEGRALVQATPGQLAITNLRLRRLILIAYDLQDDQLADDQGWINSASYDIQAKTDGNPSVEEMEGPMLQSLLRERFKLIVHRETRQTSVYKLSVAKGGKKLQPSQASSCTPYSENSPPPTGESRLNFCGLHAAINGSNRTLDGKGVTISALAASLSRAYTAALGRSVIDETGLAGEYDIHLEWSTEPSASATDDAVKAANSDLQGPSIFTALQEQLGLKLESAKAPVEVLVIDHIERPSEN